MNNGVEIMDVQTAFDNGEKCEFVLGYTLEGIVAGKTEEILGKIEKDDFTEVRFFSEDKEIHIFSCDGEKKAVCVTDECGEYIIKKYKMEEKFKAGKYLYVKEFLDYDKDGQLQIAKTCLFGFGA